MNYRILMVSLLVMHMAQADTPAVPVNRRALTDLKNVLASKLLLRFGDKQFSIDMKQLENAQEPFLNWVSGSSYIFKTTSTDQDGVQYDTFIHKYDPHFFSWYPRYSVTFQAQQTTIVPKTSFVCISEKAERIHNLAAARLALQDVVKEHVDCNDRNAQKLVNTLKVDNECRLKERVLVLK